MLYKSLRNLRFLHSSADNSQRRQWHPTPVLLPGKSHGWRSLVGCSPWGRYDFIFTFHFHALEKEMATHSSVLAWKIPGTGKPGGLPSMGSHRVGHDWSNLAAAPAADNSNINNFKLLFYTGGVLELHKTWLKGVTHNDIFRMKRLLCKMPF